MPQVHSIDPTVAGQCAIVTGAAGGLGRATACMFASRGVHVSLLDIDNAGLERTATAVSEFGGTSDIHVVDVTNEQDINEFYRRYLRTGRPLHILVNNAGGWR